MKLSQKSKNISEKSLNFQERMYIPTVAKGLFVTLKHFFSKKVTVKYPEQQRYLGPIFRGQHVLKRDEKGAERCTACGLCALACPAEAISMLGSERKIGEEHLYKEEKYASVYEINMLRCIFCGLCEEACPKEAIFLRHDLMVPPFSNRQEVIYGKEKLVEKKEERYLRKGWKT